ncbi:MAG: hemolysin family protein [Clostridiales bacterium]|nr:hemolysin family protein [Clostridiales bacterium]
MDTGPILILVVSLLAIVIVCLSVIIYRLTGNMSKSNSSRNKEEEENEYEEEIMNIALEGHEQGAILADEAEMISNIFEFGEKDAKDVMQFRRKIVGIEAGTPLQEAIRFMVEQHYSRYPVYEEDLDHIVGTLHFRDAVKSLLEDQEADKPVEDIMRKASYVHEAMDINELLTQMRQNKSHQAIVVDEYGQTVGLIAMEDILETIVGDIFDEYDVEEKEIIKLPGGGHLASGMIRLDELKESLNITFDTDEFDILNGFLVNEVGHLPEAGEKVCVHFKGYVFTAVGQADKVLRQIRIEKETEDNLIEEGGNITYEL